VNCAMGPHRYVISAIALLAADHADSRGTCRVSVSAPATSGRRHQREASNASGCLLYLQCPA
jgi:hypothetical protein